MAVERLTSWGYAAEGVLIFLLAEYERDILSSLDKYVREKNYYIFLLDGKLMLLLFLCNPEPQPPSSSSLLSLQVLEGP